MKLCILAYASTLHAVHI